MNAPVVLDRERNGWRLDAAAQLAGTQYELPGLWLSAEEIHALLTMQHLLANLDASGLHGPHIAPLTERFHRMLGSGVRAGAEVVRRIPVQSTGARKLHLPHFEAVGTALLCRQRLHIGYHGRSRDPRTRGVAAAADPLTRQLVPGHLVPPTPRPAQLCGGRDAQRARARQGSGRHLRTRLDAVLGAGYGIFAGRR